MKAITLIQPWATLIQLGEKTIETRSWNTNYRGELAIHAGKKIDKSVFSLPYYKEIFESNGITPDNIPTSCIIATCTLSEVLPTEQLIKNVSEKELVFGNFTPNRFGWVLKNVKIVYPFLYAKGMLGLWNVDI